MKKIQTIISFITFIGYLLIVYKAHTIDILNTWMWKVEYYTTILINIILFTLISLSIFTKIKNKWYNIFLMILEIIIILFFYFLLLEPSEIWINTGLFIYSIVILFLISILKLIFELGLKKYL